MIGLLLLIMLALATPVRQEIQRETVTPNSWQASLLCSAGSNNKAQTSGIRGPDGRIFVLAITSDDDHSKDSHQCESAYSLLVTLPGEPVHTVSLGGGTVDRHGRRIEIRAEGFSPDGGRFFGLACENGVAVTSESGKKPYQRRGVNATLIEYQIGSGQISTFALSRLIPYPLGCGAEVVRVVGVTATGEAVLVLNGEKSAHRWAIHPESKYVRPFPKDMIFLPLNRTH